MKFLSLLILLALFTFAAPAQDDAPGPGDTPAQAETKVTSLIGKFDFDVPSEQIITYQLLDNNTRLWMLGPNTLQIWDVPNKKVISSAPHGILGLNKYTFGGMTADRQRVLVLSARETHEAFRPDPVTGSRPEIPYDIIDEGKKSGTVFTRKAAVWDIESQKRLVLFDQPVYAGRWSKDGKTLMLSDTPESSYFMDSLDNPTYSFYDAADLKPRNAVTAKDVTWNYLTPDGNYFYFTTSPKKGGFLGIPWVNGMASVVNIWNTRTGQMEKGLSVGGEEYATLTWKLYPSPSGRFMVMVAKHKNKDAEHKLIFWELNGSATPKYTIKASPRIRDSMIRYSPDEEFFALDAGKNVQIYVTLTGQFKSELKDAALPSYWMDNNRLVFDVYTRRAGVIDTAAGDKLYDLPLLYITDEVSIGSYTDANGNTTESTTTVVRDYTRIVPHPDGLTFLTFSNQWVKVFDIRQGQQLDTVVEPPFSVVKIKSWLRNSALVDAAGWSGDGKILFVIDSNRNTISLWNFARN